jgi:hypothetical protein
MLTMTERVTQVPSEEKKPKKIINIERKVYKPLINVEKGLDIGSKALVNNSLSHGLSKVRESRDMYRGQDVATLQSKFITEMLEKLFDEDNDLSKLKNTYAKKDMGQFHECQLVINQINSTIIESLKNKNNKIEEINTSINIPNMNIPETLTILASYLGNAIPTEFENSIRNQTFFAKSEKSGKINDMNVSDKVTRIRATPNDLRGHDGGPGHIHLEMSFKIISKNQKISINIHIYPNLNQFSSVL